MSDINEIDKVVIRHGSVGRSERIEDFPDLSELSEPVCAYCGYNKPIYKYGGKSEPICHDCAGAPPEDYPKGMRPYKGKPYQREEPKIGRNEPCPCGSGRKYKKCCLNL